MKGRLRNLADDFDHLRDQFPAANTSNEVKRLNSLVVKIQKQQQSIEAQVSTEGDKLEKDIIFIVRSIEDLFGFIRFKLRNNEKKSRWTEEKLALFSKSEGKYLEKKTNDFENQMKHLITI